MSYIQLKCIIVISINVHLAYNFFFAIKDLNFPKIREKLRQQRLLASYARKNYIRIIFQKKYIAGIISSDSMQQNPKQGYHKNFGGKTQQQRPYRVICTQIVALLSLITYMLCINFLAILSNTNRDMLIPKILENVLLQRRLLLHLHQKLIDFNLC